jgi:CheY-like chemotaxis protein
LLVEDENIVALDIQHRLKKLGYTVVGWATTGPDAIEQAAKMYPDLILMDIRLKGEMDGITASEQIRSCLDIPVVYLTAYSDEATLQRANRTEPYGYLLKPFADRDLDTTIAIALYRYQTEQELKESGSFRLRSGGSGDPGKLPQRWPEA